MITAEVPEALAKDPLSPIFPSQLDTMVPSGMALTGRMLPIDNEAINNFKLKRKETYLCCQRRRIGRCTCLQLR